MPNEVDSARAGRRQPEPPATATPGHAARCKRCRKPIDTDDQSVFLARTGLCFWCAYIDSQG